MILYYHDTNTITISGMAQNTTTMLRLSVVNAIQDERSGVEFLLEKGRRTNLNNNIGWCTATWNCLRGCSWASPGCDHCYAESIAKRFGHAGQPYEGTYDYQANRWSGQVTFQEHKLGEPLKVRNPQLVFANSMSDICHPEVRPEWIDAILYHMTGAEQHYYMMLTKRPHLIKQKFWGPRSDGEQRFYTPTSWPARLAMGTSIENEKHLFRAYRLLESWPGDCFLSIEPPTVFGEP